MAKNQFGHQNMAISQNFSTFSVITCSVVPRIISLFFLRFLLNLNGWNISFEKSGVLSLRRYGWLKRDPRSFPNKRSIFVKG